MTDDPTAQRVTHAWMEHLGYEPEQIAAAEAEDHARCHGDPDDQCVDENGESHHPATDELDNTAALVVFTLEAAEVAGLRERLVQAERERDSLARRCAARFEESERLRSERDAMRSVVEAAAVWHTANRYAELVDEHLDTLAVAVEKWRHPLRVSAYVPGSGPCCKAADDSDGFAHDHGGLA